VKPPDRTPGAVRSQVPRAFAVPAAGPRPPVGRPAPWEGTDLPPGVYRWGVAAATALGAALRLAHVARPFNRLMAWNEGHYAMIALNFDRYGPWVQHNELGIDRTFSPGVPWLIWASFRLFGPTEWAARLPIVLSGIAAVALLAALVRRLLRSEQIALVTAAFAACAPGLVYFAQNVQLDTPSICCALGAAALLLRYRETHRRRDLAGAGVWLAAAVWFKFTAALLYPAFLAIWWPARPARTREAVVEAAAFIGLTALPSLVWIASGWLASSGAAAAPSVFTWRFFHRDWDLRGLAKAFSEVPLAVEAHLFAPMFLLLFVGIPLAARWRARLRELWIWCAPWAIPYLLAPWDSLVNRYYDLPVTYLLTALAALGLWKMRGGPRARPAAGGDPERPRDGERPAAGRGAVAALPRPLLAGLVFVVAVTVLYDALDPMIDAVARATMAHAAPVDPSPFYSAKIVARLPRGRTIVDTPQTMFYAGGDPAWIEITGGDVRWKIDGEEFDYIVLNDYGHGQEPYYAIDAALRAQLARHHYIQIAPAAWAHERTAVADLGGYRDPRTASWSPAPPRPGGAALP